MPAWRCTILASLGLFVSTSLAWAERPDARRQLEAQGLRPRGNTWVVALEIELRKRLDQLDQQERVFYPVRDQFRTTTAQYAQAKTQLEGLLELARSGRIRLKKNSLFGRERQQLESQIKQYDQQASQLEKRLQEELNLLDEHSAFTRSVVQFANAQNALGAYLLALQRDCHSAEQWYEPLRADPQIALALQAEGVQLGPLEPYARRYAGRFARLAREVFADGVPFYRRAGQRRIPAILNERIPATFSLADTPGPTLIPSSVAQAASIRVPDDAPTRRLGRLQTRQVRLPALRFGDRVFRNVEAWALPPEGENLGASISPTAFAGHTLEVDDQRLWVRIVPTSDSLDSAAFR